MTETLALSLVDPFMEASSPCEVLILIQLVCLHKVQRKQTDRCRVLEWFTCRGSNGFFCLHQKIWKKMIFWGSCNSGNLKCVPNLCWHVIKMLVFEALAIRVLLATCLITHKVRHSHRLKIRFDDIQREFNHVIMAYLTHLLLFLVDIKPIYIKKKKT